MLVRVLTSETAAAFCRGTPFRILRPVMSYRNSQMGFFSTRRLNWRVQDTNDFSRNRRGPCRILKLKFQTWLVHQRWGTVTVLQCTTVYLIHWADVQFYLYRKICRTIAEEIRINSLERTLKSDQRLVSQVTNSSTCESSSQFLSKFFVKSSLKKLLS